MVVASSTRGVKPGIALLNGSCPKKAPVGLNSVYPATRMNPSYRKSRSFSSGDGLRRPKSECAALFGSEWVREKDCNPGPLYA